MHLASVVSFLSPGATLTLSGGQYWGAGSCGGKIASGHGIDEAPITIRSTEGAVVDCDNTGPVIENVIVTGNLRLEGIHFTNAYRSGGGGGVLWMERSSRIEIDDCRFSNSSSGEGGAVSVSGSHLLIADSHFEENTADTAGALAILDESHAVITNSVFVACSAAVDAGAIFVARSSTLQLSRSHLLQNHADNFGGALVAMHQSRVNISTTIFEANINLVWQGGALSVLYGSSIRISGRPRPNRGADFGYNSDPCPLQWNY